MLIQKRDGQVEPKGGKGTPQGCVISLLLTNLYLHFVLDMWLSTHYRQVSFVRYADDIILHCNSKAEGEEVLKSIKARQAGETPACLLGNQYPKN